MGRAPHGPYPTGKDMYRGRYSERANPTVEVLLGIVDEVEEQLAEGGDLLLGC